MKRGKPVPIKDIPAHGRGPGRRSPNEQLFQDVLRLNGSAVPLEFDSITEATRFASANKRQTGRARKLGLKVQQRGRVVYLLRGK